MPHTISYKAGTTPRLEYPDVPLRLFTSLSSFRTAQAPRGSVGAALVVDRDESDPTAGLYAWHDTSVAVDDYDTGEDVSSCTANIIITPDSDNDGVVDTVAGRWVRVLHTPECTLIPD